MGKVLALYDVRGIQDYIFRTPKVKEAIGASKTIETIFARQITRLMSDFVILKGRAVSYRYPNDPAMKPDVKVYEWFVNNHGGYNRKTGRPTNMPYQNAF